MPGQGETPLLASLCLRLLLYLPTRIQREGPRMPVTNISTLEVALGNQLVPLR